MPRLTHAAVGDVVVFPDGYPGPYPYVGIVESIEGDQLTFRGLEEKIIFTRPITDFYEANSQDRERAARLLKRT